MNYTQLEGLEVKNLDGSILIHGLAQKHLSPRLLQSSLIPPSGELA
jgi:hypothetical protein